MNMPTNRNTGTNTLSFAERVLRVAVGSAFVGSIFATTTTVLDWQVVLPLIGSYAVVSGLTGTGILRSFLDNRPTMYRSVQLALSAVLIGSVFIDNTAPLGLMAILPMIGVYAALSALLGQSPVSAILESARVIPHIVSQSGELIEASRHDVRRKTAATLSHVA